MRGIITIDCPKMLVTRQKLGLRRAAEEPCVVDITLDDGSSFHCPRWIIPPTYVRIVNLSLWMVDECVGKGKLVGGGELVLTLPKEPVEMSFSFERGMYVVAKRIVTIDAKSYLTLPDGRRGNAIVTFDDCPAYPLRRWRFDKFVADAIVARGTVDV